MIGVIITFFSTFFDEISSSVTKAKLNQGQISMYSIGLISSLSVASIFIFINIIQWEFYFSAASLPTIVIRTILEIILFTLFSLICGVLVCGFRQSLFQGRSSLS